MWFPSWLRSSIPSDAGRHSPARRPSVKPGGFRPRLEALEGRDVPSTLTVTSPKDHGAGTLRDAIAAANPNDVIVLSPKLDGKTITLTSGELDITKNLTIQGPGANQLVVSGGFISRAFEVAPNVTVTLSGVAITGGTGRAMGYLSTGSVNGYGGGIYNQGILTVSGCTISGNSADDSGGGIYNAPGAALAVSGGTVSGNNAGVFGGGIDNDGTLAVSGGTVSGNNAEDGGGICNFSRATVGSSTVSDNSATDGGGIYTSGVMTVSGCTLTGNGAGEVGGGICNVGTLAASGCAVSGNVLGPSGRSGGGIFTGGTGGALTVSNSTFSTNSPDSISGVYVDAGGNAFI